MSKPYLSPSQQVQHLISRKGLIIRDVAYAERKLTDIEYTSLIGGYKTPFINPMTRMYEGSTTFEDVLELYLFDKELRLITFAMLNTVEGIFFRQWIVLVDTQVQSPSLNGNELKTIIIPLFRLGYQPQAGGVLQHILNDASIRQFCLQPLNATAQCLLGDTLAVLPPATMTCGAWRTARLPSTGT